MFLCLKLLGFYKNYNRISISRNTMQNKVKNSIAMLDQWIKTNGFAGWDPYDIQEHPIIKKIYNQPNYLPNRAIKKLSNILIDCFPIFLRRLLRIKKQINSKAMGLLLASYSQLYITTNDSNYLTEAIKIATWLIKNRSKKYKNNFCWGYPFDWDSNIFTPKDTPSAVVSSIVGDGFYLLYQATNDIKYLNICKNICNFFLNDLNKTYNTENKLCFSYTPLDDFKVHNANLFIGEFLIRTGKTINDQTLVNLGLACGNYALSEQSNEGYIPYWAIDQTNKYSNGKIHLDHYHCGFEIRMLFKIWQHTGISTFRNAYENYFQWYCKTLFTEDNFPKFMPNLLYPINIHTITESILCQATLLTEHPERLPTINSILNWTIDKLMYKPGEYIYLIHNYPLIGNYKCKITMLRWGQAWMFRALSELLLKLHEQSIS